MTRKELLVALSLAVASWQGASVPCTEDSCASGLVDGTDEESSLLQMRAGKEDEKSKTLLDLTEKAVGHRPPPMKMGPGPMGPGPMGPMGPMGPPAGPMGPGPFGPPAGPAKPFGPGASRPVKLGSSPDAPTSADLDELMAAFQAAPQQELTFPESFAAGEVMEIDFMEGTLPIPFMGGSYQTRTYGGTIPGKTMVVNPGDTIKIKFSNKLGKGPDMKTCPSSYKGGDVAGNVDGICQLNYTNFHFHGLHVSPEGNSDNVLLLVNPGESSEIEVKIPENHMPGTHWYHPHNHHSTAAQAGGGAFGAIIVKEPAGYLPKQIEEMPEKLMFLSLVNAEKGMRLEDWGIRSSTQKYAEQKLWINSAYPGWRWEEKYKLEDYINPYVAINGQWLPKITVEEGKWYRMRFVLAAIEYFVEVYESDNTQAKHGRCEFQLLSKDGVFLHEAPRVVSKLHLISGSRADVAMRCGCVGSSTNQLEVGSSCSANYDFTASFKPMGTKNDAALGAYGKTYTNKLMTFVIEANKGDQLDPDLTPFSVRRPCYVANLRDAEPYIKRSNVHTVDFPQSTAKVVVDGYGKPWPHGELPPPLAELPVGEIQQWHVSGVNWHPMHIHVNPFQVFDVTPDPDNWFQLGDWQDTLFLTTDGEMTVRINIDSFVGTMVMHCHILEHEDNGMMGYWSITGKEGTTFANNKALDPTCYEGSFPDTGYWGK
eukprot:CAMPEP_0206506760 /NCGR_PEP_ID=MMETSP0324_2-20121206/57024_1 /ASSEMBLY_ACC=CAM_ASM_000836 /TAXON_ID=2866 /ORGANISM="Crypthecodinium cohnii, Strain Seligo" /LENGTH=707 /DNA_ID=CAMNT_0053996685 /DNA_START=46 /DNA_END=2169 /DNA_ORIENTATION=-